MTDADTFQVGALARAVLDAQEEAHQARMDGLHDPDKAWTRRVAEAHADEVLAAWQTLLGLTRADRGLSIRLARQHAANATTAHSAPF